MSDENRNAMLNILAETQKLMHQRRVQGLVRSANASTANTPGQSPTLSALTTSSAFGDQRIRSLDYIGARDNRSDFFDTWSRAIESFVNDSTRTSLDLPAELDSNDRRVLHQLADKYNLGHSSVGKGLERHLVLKKDTLFYRAANKMVDHDAIDALKNKKEAAHGSRFHLRKANPNDNTGLLEGAEEAMDAPRKDSQLEKALSVLDRATNQFAYASENTMGPPSMEAIGGPTSSEADRFLSRNQASSRPPQHQPHQGQTASGFAEVPSTWAAAMKDHKQVDLQASAKTSSVLKDVITHEEQCTSCGTSSPLDYAVSEWTCVGPCSKCNKDVVFRLVERKRRVVVAAEGAATASIGAKRAREEPEQGQDRQHFESSSTSPAATVQPPKAESIEREPEVRANVQPIEEIIKEDEDEELIPLETSDLVSMLECNDYDSSIVNWFAGFASGPLNGNADAIGARIAFVMEFSDLSSRGPAVAADGTSQVPSPATSRLSVKLKASAIEVSALIEELWSKAFNKSTDIVFGLTNMSVAGIDVEMVINGPGGIHTTEVLTDIQSRVGRNRLSF